VSSFRAGGATGFYFDREAASENVRHLERVAPGWTERVVADADRLRQGLVRLLGDDAFDIRAHAAASGERRAPIRWHDDVFSGYHWDPRTFYRQVPFPYGEAEAKVPWELSRFQHLPTLGMAYLATGLEEYAHEIVSEVQEWIDSNPVGRGINWVCTMEVAIRAVNWLWALQMIAGAAPMTDAFVTRFLASLVSHGNHISKNIEVYEGGITTNHTVADYVGLVYLGLLLPELDDAAAWADTGLRGMVESMAAQIGPDGVDFENSIPYHRLVLEMFLDVYLLALRHDRPMPEPYRASLERMLEFVWHYTRPDGLAPLVGDSDDGRLQILSDYFGWDPQDHRYLLGLGAAVFERDDFAALAAGAPGAIEQAVWFLGPRGSKRLEQPGPVPERESRAFPASGRFVMRIGGHYAIVSTDEVGSAGLGNHKHNDIFSFELCVDGVPIVVDNGSFLYISDPVWRDRFRATSAHSTLVVDGSEQNHMVGPFDMRLDARVSVADWSSTSELDFLDASHSGYERLAQPVTHRRRFWFRKEPFAWLVMDSLQGRGTHPVESYLHFAAGGELAGVTDQATRRAQEIEETLASLEASAGMTEGFEAHSSAALTYRNQDTTVLIVPVNWSAMTAEHGWASPRWGRREKAPAIRLAGQLAEGRSVGYIILPT
jgi:uncharacterized heparinase superfamily protein